MPEQIFMRGLNARRAVDKTVGEYLLAQEIAELER